MTITYFLTCLQGRDGQLDAFTPTHWPLSHSQDLFLEAFSHWTASSWWTDSAHIVNTIPLPIHTLHILFQPHPYLLLSSHANTNIYTWLHLSLPLQSQFWLYHLSNHSKLWVFTISYYHNFLLFWSRWRVNYLPQLGANRDMLQHPPRPQWGPSSRRWMNKWWWTE